MNERNCTLAFIIMVVLVAPKFCPVSFHNSISIFIDENTKLEHLGNSVAQAAHDPIEIYSDEDFVAQNWPGNGTEENPYRIENLEIGGSGIVLHISDTRVYFAIENCTALYRHFQFSNVSNGQIRDCDLGSIELIESFNSTIHNNTLIPNYPNSGIALLYSNNTSVSNNYVNQYNAQGIYVLDCFNTLLENNTLPGIGYETWHDRGIYIENSYNSTIRNNEIGNHSFEAIALSSCEKVQLDGNYIHNGKGAAVDIRYTTDCMFSSNEFISCGITIVSTRRTHWNLSFIDNTVNGMELGFIRGQSNTSLDVSSYGQVIALDCFNVTFQNGSFSNCSMGFILGFSNICEIRQNTIQYNNKGGIQVQHSSLCNVSDNTIRHINTEFMLEGSGISLINASQSIVSENEIEDCVIGIDLMSGNAVAYENQQYHNNLTNNSILDCGIGIYSTVDTALSNNALQHCGIVGAMFDNVNNTVNGMDVGYFTSDTGLVVDGSHLGQIILWNCSNSWVVGGDFSRASVGIQITSSSNTSIQAVKSTDNIYGVLMQHANFTTLADIEVESNSEGGGIYIFRCYNILLEHVKLVKNLRAIEAYAVTNLTISSCVISDNTQGVWINYESGYYSSSPASFHLLDCYFSRNGGSVFVLDPPSSEVPFSGSIRNNTFWDKGHGGLDLNYASNLLITENRIYWDSLYIAGENITVYNNEFGMSEIEDDGTNNTWDNGVDTGNYWFPSVESEQYSLPGTGNGIDRFPRKLMYIIPTDNFLMEEGSEGNVIEWNTFALHPVNYSIDIRESTDSEYNSFMTEQNWDGHNVSVTLDDLTEGQYYFRVTIVGLYGIQTQTEVLVYVTASGDEPSFSMDWVLITVGAAGLILVVVVFIVRKLRR